MERREVKREDRNEVPGWDAKRITLWGVRSSQSLGSKAGVQLLDFYSLEEDKKERLLMFASHPLVK